MSQHDEHDDLSALDFSSYQSGSDDDGQEHADALDFSAASDTDEESHVDALDAYAPAEDEEVDTGLHAIAATTERAEDEDDEDDVQQFTVANPPETVSVSALIDGRTQRVTLSPTATNLTEAELADEIIVLAELARQKGLAGQRTYVMDSAADNAGLQQLDDMGLDSSQLLRDFVETGMRLPTEEQAETAQAEVFATRYTADK
ncbi:hypothetical protein [Mycobacterium stomatepiae]|uniref:ESX-1 secretion-associated protein EspH n=1 Tax=Mycobacterium stomatepiae TaxID=470076 RepID=A0A7I7QCR5_9MYCO|nr:hypothetical protein [Mycobacterium stomatepiae]BBY23817.1 ESX-1 secretion-associated protein EspH [Mycobacterium stomatepiae]